MKSDDAILARWVRVLAQNGPRPAVMNADGAVARTFSGIETESQEWAGHFKKAPPARVLAVQIGNHPAWPAVFLAALRCRLPVLPLETTITAREREAAVAMTGAWALMTADEHGQVSLRTETAASLTNAAFAGQDYALLKFTSGTTAAPRAVCFRREQLLADCDNICQTMGIHSSDLNYGVIPVSHSYGFSNLLTPLIARGVAMVMTRDRLPRAVLNGLAASRATVFPGMPVFYQAFCAMDEIPALPELRLCISAGAPLTSHLARQFQDRFGRSIHSFYGSSECGGICYDRTAKHLVDGFVGTPLENVSVRLRESDGRSGPIEVQSRAVADTYFPEPDRKKLDDGIFRPDDLLLQSDQGFQIAGRISDLINVAGKKVNPVEVEAHLLSIKGVREAVVFGRPSSIRNEEVTACVVAEESLDEAGLLRSCRTHLNGWQIPRRIFLVPEIPVNERGKTSRRQLSELFASG